jgi:subtilisin family serine protease
MRPSTTLALALALLALTSHADARPRPARDGCRRAGERLARALETCPNATYPKTCETKARRRYDARRRRLGCAQGTAAQAATFVGSVGDSKALVAVVADAERVLAWVCGDAASSAWARGSAPRGAFDLSAEGPTKARLRGRRAGDGFDGELVLADGSVRAWHATRTRGADAGLYLHADQDGTTALVVGDDGTERGVSTLGGALAPVGGASTGGTGGTRRVVVQAGVRRLVGVDLVRITTPTVTLPPPTVVVPPAPRRTLEVKFRDGLGIRLVGDRPIDVEGHALADAAWQHILDLLDDQPWHRLHDVPERQLALARAIAVARSGRALPDPNLWFTVVPPPSADPLLVARLLHHHPDVAFVEFAPTAFPAVVDDLTELPNDVGLSQGYLIAAPVGIDARYARQFHRGAGIRIADVEGDFTGAHPDLPSIDVLGDEPDMDADVRARFRRHGTAVLGILGSRADGQGTTGIADEADLAFASHTTTDPDTSSVASAVTRSAVALSDGDLIVIEVHIPGPACPDGACNAQNQDGLVPAEFNMATYDAVVLATALGRTVVAAAGNGRVDLDAAVFDQPRFPDGPVFNPFLPENDSGAVIVGATDPVTRQPMGFTNFGRRVDVNAWGTGVLTTTSGHLKPNEICDPDDDDRCYETSFGGTSAATPIVAGGAALLQGIFQDRHDRFMTPDELRSLLVATGRRQPAATAGAAFKRVGPRPDLRLAVDTVRGQLPRPTIDPAPGRTFDKGIEVRMDYGSPTQDLFNSLILFTLDGHEPTFTDEDAFEYVPEPDDPNVYLFFRRTFTFTARSFLRTLVDPATDENVASARLSGIYYFSEPDVGEVAFSLPEGTYAAPQELDLDHPDPSAIIWYTFAETDDPNDVPAPEMLQPGSLLFFRNVDLRSSLAPVVTIKARAYAPRAADGRIVPGPVTTRTYNLTAE